MKIAIEAQRILRPNKHGMDFVALETIRQLQKIDLENEYFILVAPGNDQCIESTDNFHIVTVNCPTYPLWEQIALPMALKQINPDILHCTSNTAPILCRCQLVLTLHDIIFFEKRTSLSRSLYQNMGWYYRKFVVPRVLPNCSKIITVSEFERGRISSAIKVPSDKLVAIHNGVGEHFYYRADYRDVTKRYIDSDKYLFFLGNTDPKKNTARTLAAYGLYVSQNRSPLPLLVADLSRKSVDALLHEMKIDHISKHIVCAGYIPNSDLPYIYSGASAFLYPSLRESFGIPILEAMACGAPVITSATSAIPEVAGRGAILIDPLQPQQIADKLLQLEQDAEFRSSCVQYGYGRVKAFSWERTAYQLLDLYKSLAPSL